MHQEKQEKVKNYSTLATRMKTCGRSMNPESRRIDMATILTLGPLNFFTFIGICSHGLFTKT